MANVVEDLEKWVCPEKPIHAHFDCFSGAAGDMMLSACLDAAGEKKSSLLRHVVRSLEEGMPELKGEFSIETKQVWRGMGSIAAVYVNVQSKYNHEAAPVPARSDSAKENAMRSVHDHNHDHSSGRNDSRPTPPDTQGHNHGHDHGRDHGQAHWHAHSHQQEALSHDHGSEHAHSHGHSHNHQQEASGSSATSNEEDHNQSHSHGHAHSHENSSAAAEKGESSHSHTGNSQIETISNHSHSHDHTSSHDHSHSHGHESASKGPLRNLPQIRKMLQEAPEEHISPWVVAMAIAAFSALAEAEAKTHGAASSNAVNFHEVGAVDSIVDTVGTLIALDALGAKTISCSRLPLGEGMVWTDHGLLPVPAPATLRLMIGMPTCPGPKGVTGELVTPTAAALLKACVKTSAHQITVDGRPPAFTIRTVGIGAGTKDFERHPNILRVMLGDTIAESGRKDNKS